MSIKTVDVDTSCSCRNRLDEEMTATKTHVEAISPYVVFPNKSAGETDSEVTGDLEGPQVVGEDVRAGSKEGRGFEKDNVLPRDVLDKVREYV